MPSMHRTTSGRVTSRGHWSGRRSTGFWRRVDGGEDSFGSPRPSLGQQVPSEEAESQAEKEKWSHTAGAGGCGDQDTKASSLSTKPPRTLVHARAASMPDLTLELDEPCFDLSPTAEDSEEGGGWHSDRPSPGSPKGRTLSGGYPGTHQLSRTRSVEAGRSSTGGLVQGGPPSGMFQPVTARYNMDSSTSLGSGGYAVVRRAVRKQDGEEVAVKIMRVGKPKHSSSDEDEDEDAAEEDMAHPEAEYSNEALSFEEIMTEIEVVQQLHHDNIVNIYEYFIHRGSCFIVMKLLRGKELMDALLEHGPYTEADVRVMMGSLLDAIAYMHLMGVTHRDLKLENLVLSRPGDLSSVTIVDFGLAKAARAREKMEDVCGTLWYYAPEIVNAKPYTPLVDEWALGVAMYLLLTGKFPFEAEDDDEETLCELIVNGLRGDLGSREEFEDVSHLAVDVLHGLLTVRPEERLPAAEAVEHPWVTGSDNMAGLQASTAKSLHHVHTRLQKLVTTTGLHGRQFDAGSWIIEPTTEMQTVDDDDVVYLIAQGECELLVRRPAGCFVRVGKRRQGNFIGQGQVLLSTHQLRSLAGPSPPSSPNSCTGLHVLSKTSQQRGELTVDIDRAIHSTSSQQGGANARVARLSLDPEAQFMPQQPGSTSSELSPTSPPQVGALLAAGASNHLQTKHAVWVRAVTNVEAVELAKEDMQWALEDDYRLGTELREAMYTRRRELRKKQKQAATQPGKIEQPLSGATSPQSQWSPMWSPVAASRRAAMFDAVPDFVLDGEGDTGEEGGDPAFGLAPSTSASSGNAPDGLLGYALRLNDYKAGIGEMMQEYFQAQEVGEVAASLAELQTVCGNAPLLAQRADISSLGEVFVKKAIVTALDFAAREFELTAVLISALAPGMLKAVDIGAAFQKLLRDLNDVRTQPCIVPRLQLMAIATSYVSFCLATAYLTLVVSAQLALDVPTAPSLLPLFLARFVLDETLPVAFLDSLADELTHKEGLKALQAAKALLGSSDGTTAVLHAWGGGGAGSVAHSKQAFAAILGDYVDRIAASVESSDAKVTAFEFMVSPACVSDWLQAAFADVLREKPCNPMAAMAERCRGKAASLKASGNTGAKRSVVLPTDGLAATNDAASRRDPRMVACRSVREMGVPHFLWEFVRQTFLLAVENPAGCKGLAPHQLTAAAIALLVRLSGSGLVLRDQFELGFSIANAAVQECPVQANILNGLVEQLKAAGIDFVKAERHSGTETGAFASAHCTTSLSTYSNSSISHATQARQGRAAALGEAGK